MGYKIKTILFLSLEVLCLSLFIYNGCEMNKYYIMLFLIFNLSFVLFLNLNGNNLILSKEKRDLINYCEDNYIEQFKETVNLHFSTKEKLEGVQLLVYFNFTKQGVSLLIAAVANNSPKIVKYLLEEKKYNIDIQSKNNETALMRAVFYNKIEIIKLILKFNPNLELVNQVSNI